MRVIHQSAKSFLGTHKGSTIEINREHDGRFYICVFNECGFGYDGWAPNDIRAMPEALKEAIRGARLNDKSRAALVGEQKCNAG